MTRKQLLNGNINSPEDKLNLKQLELNALLEVTEAINYNHSEEALYRIYHFTLLSNLHISKLALFVLDDNWECKVQYGCSQKLDASLINEKVLAIDKITEASEASDAGIFDVIIPISHKSEKLAFIFLGGVVDLNLGESDNLLSFVQTLTSIIIVAIENKKLARHQLQQEALRKELEIASKVQSNLFPVTLPDSKRIQIHASYYPHRMVGGDYYDCYQLSEDKFLFCIADVSGKGIPAALLMSSFQSGLKTLVRRTQDLKDIVKELNFLVKENARGDRFITFFGAIADLKNGKLSYINAGHNPPLLFKNKQVTLLEKGTTVLGAFDDLPFIEEDSVEIPGGSFLFAYTDGLTETMNDKSEEYGTDRLESLLKKENSFSPASIHERVLDDLKEFKGKQQFPDDITFLSCLFL